MDLYNGGRENGTEIVGWAGGDANNDHQRWRFITGDADHKDMVKYMPRCVVSPMDRF